MEWDDSIVIRLSIALVTWVYVYARVVYEVRFEEWIGERRRAWARRNQK
jgi:hypothetical protein